MGYRMMSRVDRLVQEVATGRLGRKEALDTIARCVAHDWQQGEAWTSKFTALSDEGAYLEAAQMLSERCDTLDEALSLSDLYYQYMVRGWRGRRELARVTREAADRERQRNAFGSIATARVPSAS
jgi:hypothetical protein